MSAFTSWQGVSDIDVTVSLAIYPGRDYRMKEHPLRDIRAMADEIAAFIVSLPQEELESIVLIGHSMGAQVAFEACGRLERKGLAPLGLVLSACHAPHLQSRRRLAHLDDARFMQELLEIGGCNEAIRNDPEILRPFLPCLRADFLATETYGEELQGSNKCLSTTTVLLYGTQDVEASEDEVAAWREWLELPPVMHAVPGGHFYITERPRLIVGRAMELFHQHKLL